MKKILVIDDDIAVRKATSKTLHKCGYEVLEAADGELGLELARHRLPDLVLSDIKMGEVDGYDVLQGLRSEPATSAIPVILMTGEIAEQNMRCGMELGADDYLLKPFAPKTLREAVQARLNRQHTIQTRASQHEGLLLEILSATQDLVAVVDAETSRLFYLNRAGRRMLGIGEEEDASGLRLEDFQVGSQTNGTWNGHLPEAKTQSVWIGESAFLGRHGRHIPVAKQILAHYSADQQVIYLSVVASDITERKQMDESLRKSENRYRELLHCQGEGIVYSDAQLRFTFANPAAENLFGVWPGQLLGKTFGEFLDSANRSVAEREFKLHQAGGKSSYEIEIIQPRGGRRQLLVTGTPHLDAEGNFCGTVAIFRDITQRKQAEQALRESQRLLRAILDNIPDPAWLKDAQGRYLVGNKSLARIYQRRLEDIVGKTVFEAFPSCALKLAEGDQQAASSGQAVRGEDCIPDGEGHNRWFDTIETPVLNEAGLVTGTVGIARDITERRQTEMALRESDASYHSLFENMMEGFACCRMIFDGDRADDFVYLSVNSAFETLTGLRNVVGKKVSEVIPGIQAASPELFDLYGRVAMTGRPEKLEAFVESLDTWFSISVYSTRKEHFVAVFDVITKRKRAEAEVLESKRFLHSTLEALSSHIAILDERGAIIEVNRAWKEFARKNRLGDPNFSIGKSYLDVCDSAAGSSAEEAATVAHGIRAVMAGHCREFQLEYPCHSPDQPRWFVMRITRFSGHGPVRLVVAHENITERRQMEDDLRQKTTLFEALVNSSPDGILIVNDRGQKTLQSPQFTELLKIPPEIAEQPDDAKQLQFVTASAKNPDEFLAKVRHLNAHPEETSCDEIEFKDGRVLDRYSAPVLDQNGKCHGRIWTFRDITQRKQAEAALQQSESKFRVLFENARDAKFILDPQGRIVDANREACERLQYTREEFQRMQVQEIDAPGNGDPAPERIRQLLDQGHLIFETANRRRDGTIVPVEINSQVLVLDGQKFILAVCRDLTERKRTEEKLRLQTSALEAAANGIAITDTAGQILWINPAFTRLTGYNAAEVVGKTPAILKSGVHDQALYRNLWDTILAGNVWHGELVNRRKDGSHYHEEMTITPLRDETGKVQNFIAIKQDISDRKEIEATLSRERDLLQALMDNLPDLIYFKDTQSRFTLINRALARHFGLQSPAEGIGKSDADFFASSSSRQKLADEQCIIATGKPMLGRVEESNSTAGKCWVSSTKVPIRDEQGKITGLVGISHDITHRTLAEEELRAQRESFRALTDNVPDGIARIDRDQRFVYVNRVLANKLGRTEEQLLGRTNVELNLPAPEQWQVAVQRVFQTGQTETFEFQAISPAGVRYLEARLMPEYDSDGKVQYVLAVDRDITERKDIERQQLLTEAQLRQAQKMEAVGQLAAGIAHEINTPTQYVGDNTRFLKDAFDNIVSLLRSHGEVLTAAKANALTPEILEHAEEVLMASDIEYLFLQIPQAISETLEGVERVTKIVRAMKDFSHPGGKEKTAADLNKAIESTTTVARNEWKYVADLKLDLAPDLPLVPCFLGEFNQAILNLVINAAHAIGDVVKPNPGTKGVITIQTRLDGGQVEVRVSDTGGGIAEIHRPHIFEPFFTTKDIGKGTGQGLTLVYSSIVKKHGGTVTFETETGKGTTFILRLPIHPANPAPSEPDGDAPPASDRPAIISPPA